MSASAAARRAVLGLCCFWPLLASAQSDLYSRDTLSDTGVEPNPDPAPMWDSPDLWVRTSPDPNYRPQPFPEASPPWTPAPGEPPLYRDPRLARPNYVYVRVRNRGDAPSSGSESLRLHWTRATTGMAWPSRWNDSVATACGAPRLFGAELTKPRRNAAAVTASERTRYVNALSRMATDPAFVLPARYNYWTKQQHVHRTAPEHGNAAFLPWHRELLNRLELLMQEADPRVKLLYWNWTTDPGPLFSSTFMGASGRGTANGVALGAPLIPPLGPHSSDGPPSVIRLLSNGGPPAEPDATVLSRTQYRGGTSSFSQRLEAGRNHDGSHCYIGRRDSPADMCNVARAARDPFFYLLHGKVDELWARWQRADPARFTAATAYGTSSGDPRLNNTMRPWNGSPGIEPWTSAGGLITVKNAKDRSVVFPPIYDTAPLTVPVLQPGEAVVIEVPWYPPNPAHFECLEASQLALLSRIMPGVTESANVEQNARNNNNIAWKLVDLTGASGAAGAAPGLRASLRVRNGSASRIVTGIELRGAGGEPAAAGDGVAAVALQLEPELLERWREGGAVVEGAAAPVPEAALRSARASGGPAVGAPRPGAVRLSPRGGALRNIALEPGESFSVDAVVELAPGASSGAARTALELVQSGLGGEPLPAPGAARLQVDLSSLVLVGERSLWRYLTSADDPPREWNQPDFDDASWTAGRADLGYGGSTETTLPPADSANRPGTAYFRQVFELPDPVLAPNLQLRVRADDGVVVYLNGQEVYRANLPRGSVSPRTLALRELSGAAAAAFTPVSLDPALLRADRNVLAAEVHRRSLADTDLAFDAELAANRGASQEPPSVSFVGIEDGAVLPLGQTVRMGIDAHDPEGALASVTIFVDDRQSAVLRRPPFHFSWRARAGTHRIRAVAVDRGQRRGLAELTVTGVQNVPPLVRVISPEHGDAHRAGAAPRVEVQVSDPDDAIRSVEFFRYDGEGFTAARQSLGVLREPPYALELPNLPAGHHRIGIAVTDARGETTETGTHVEIGGHAH